MPLVITIPGKEMYDEQTEEFVYTKPTTLTLEHSLLSISKWEAKWHKPYLSREEKTREELVDYIRCMSLSSNVDPIIYRTLNRAVIDKIVEYIKDPMTATTISSSNKKPSREIVTSELIYYWMTALNIPFEPCQKWHLNRLLMLIEVASIKSQPPKKMPKSEVMRRNSALNAARRAKHGTRG